MKKWLKNTLIIVGILLLFYVGINLVYTNFFSIFSNEPKYVNPYYNELYKFEGLFIFILILDVFLLPPILSFIFGWGKGLFFGSLISVFYNLFIDFYLVKKVFGRVPCGDFCGLDNFI